VQVVHRLDELDRHRPWLDLLDLRVPVHLRQPVLVGGSLGSRRQRPPQRRARRAVAPPPAAGAPRRGDARDA